MRFRRAASAILLAAVVAGVAAAALIAEQRSASFAARAGQLQRTWAHDLAVGVPASGIAPLRAELGAESPRGGWWSPAWWTTDGSSLLARLDRDTASVYASAMSAARGRAATALAAWQGEVSTERAWLAPAQIAAVTRWSADLRTATTPARLDSLAASWQGRLALARTTVLSAQREAQQRQLAAAVAAAGGPSGLLATAGQDLSRAQADNLDPGEVPTLVGQLQGQIARGAATAQAAGALYGGLQQLDQLLALNDQLNGEIRPLELLADQAAAEGTPGAAGFLAGYAAIHTAFLAGRDDAALAPLQERVTTLQSQIQSALAADRCGHDVGAGKVITVSISLEEMVMYDGGCVVNATPVTTGRPGFPTLPGSFHVMAKFSPFQFISSYPYGSPGWYPPTWVQWAMLYDYGGYFIHNAWWEAQDAFGPGSQDEVAQDYASHGCVHVPTALMPWLYGWTPIGAAVIISD